MKVILSRKGFDSGHGGCASPIFEDRTFCSLPIPSVRPGRTYDDISWRGETLGRLVADLTKGRIKGFSTTHLDPDLAEAALPRRYGWRPLFGQTGNAQRHLDNRGVTSGDLFLFFGWFREVELALGRYRFRRGAPDLHVLFGWLKVQEVWRRYRDEGRPPDWAFQHPHVVDNLGKANTVYVSTEPGAGLSGGVFSRVDGPLVLTAPGSKLRTRWQLPGWFHPEGRLTTLSHHPNRSSWQRREDHVLLDSAKIGQEFVLDTAHYPEAETWANELIRTRV